MGVPAAERQVRFKRPFRYTEKGMRHSFRLAILLIAGSLLTIGGRADQGIIEIDIDAVPNPDQAAGESSMYRILVDSKQYTCVSASPPLSHGWVYECIEG